MKLELITKKFKKNKINCNPTCSPGEGCDPTCDPCYPDVPCNPDLPSICPPSYHP